MSQAEDILAALGGWKNIISIEPCITRLRMELEDEDIVDDEALKKAGAFGVVHVGNAMQVVVGPIADNLVEDMEDLR